MYKHRLDEAALDLIRGRIWRFEELLIAKLFEHVVLIVGLLE